MTEIARRAGQETARPVRKVRRAHARAPEAAGVGVRGRAHLSQRAERSEVARERAPKTLLVGSSLAVYATGSLSLRLTFLSLKLTFLSLKLTSLSLRLTFLSLKLTFLSLKLTSLSLRLTFLSLKLTFLSLKLTSQS